MGKVITSIFSINSQFEIQMGAHFEATNGPAAKNNHSNHEKSPKEIQQLSQAARIGEENSSSI